MATIKLTVKWTSGKLQGKTTTRKLDVACVDAALFLYEVGSSWQANDGSYIVVRATEL